MITTDQKIDQKTAKKIQKIFTKNIGQLLEKNGVDLKIFLIKKFGVRYCLTSDYYEERLLLILEINESELDKLDEFFQLDELKSLRSKIPRIPVQIKKKAENDKYGAGMKIELDHPYFTIYEEDLNYKLRQDYDNDRRISCFFELDEDNIITLRIIRLKKDNIDHFKNYVTTYASSVNMIIFENIKSEVADDLVGILNSLQFDNRVDVIFIEFKDGNVVLDMCSKFTFNPKSINTGFGISFLIDNLDFIVNYKEHLNIKTYYDGDMNKYTDNRDELIKNLVKDKLLKIKNMPPTYSFSLNDLFFSNKRKIKQSSTKNKKRRIK